MSLTQCCQPRCIAKAKHVLFPNRRIGLRFARRTEVLTWKKCDVEFRWATETICADFPSGLTFAATLAFCFPKPKRSRPRDNCEAIWRPKTWLRNRRNGWSVVILSRPA